MKELIRTITTIGSSVGVTFPRSVIAAYGLKRGDVVQIEPREDGILVKPVRTVSTLRADDRLRVREIIAQYRPALDAMARHDRNVKNR